MDSNGSNGANGLSFYRPHGPCKLWKCFLFLIYTCILQRFSWSGNLIRGLHPLFWLSPRAPSTGLAIILGTMGMGIFDFLHMLQQGMSCLRRDGAQNCTCYIMYMCAMCAQTAHFLLVLKPLWTWWRTSRFARDASHSIPRDSEKHSNYSRWLEYFSVLIYCEIKQTIKILHNNNSNLNSYYSNVLNNTEIRKDAVVETACASS